MHVSDNKIPLDNKANNNTQWILKSRFSVDKVETTLFGPFDNTKGTEPFSMKISYTKGLTLASSEQTTKSKGLEASISASVGFEVGGFGGSRGAKASVSHEATYTDFSSIKTAKSKSIETTIVVPPGSYYKVTQENLNINDNFGSNDIQMNSNYIV